MQGHPERRLRRREDRADLVGLEFALQDDPSACQFRFGVFEVVDFISEMADDRSLAILELWHAETGSADLNQLQARFTEQQKLQVDVAGENTLATSSAINGVARPGDGFVDVAHDDRDVIQPKQPHGPQSSFVSLCFLLLTDTGVDGPNQAAPVAAIGTAARAA